MNKLSIFVIIILLFSPAALVQGAEEADLPAGMEIVESGTVKVVVPEGARIIEKDGYLKVEDTQEYVARKFQEMKRRLEKIESEEEQMKQQLEELQGVLDDIQKLDWLPEQQLPDQSITPEEAEQ
ncbi:hypothetical protein ACFL1I_07450 [Candidatus Omnitrophota bacterium]